MQKEFDIWSTYVFIIRMTSYLSELYLNSFYHRAQEIYWAMQIIKWILGGIKRGLVEVNKWKINCYFWNTDIADSLQITMFFLSFCCLWRSKIAKKYVCPFIHKKKCPVCKILILSSTHIYFLRIHTLFKII